MRQRHAQRYCDDVGHENGGVKRVALVAEVALDGIPQETGICI